MIERHKMDTDATGGGKILTCLSVPTLAEFHERLVVARARLVERIIVEYDPAHQYPSTAWTRMVGDLHALIQVVDQMISEAES